MDVGAVVVAVLFAAIVLASRRIWRLVVNVETRLSMCSPAFPPVDLAKQQATTKKLMKAFNRGLRAAERGGISLNDEAFKRLTDEAGHAEWFLEAMNDATWRVWAGLEAPSEARRRVLEQEDERNPETKRLG